MTICCILYMDPIGLVLSHLKISELSGEFTAVCYIYIYIYNPDNPYTYDDPNNPDNSAIVPHSISHP